MPLSKAQVMAFHQSLSNWGRWGKDDQLGALNLITPAKKAAAARLVRSGRAVSCARPLPTQPGPENPSPVVHAMTAAAGEGWAGDYFAIAPHGFATSHLDALCHIFHEGRLYNGYSIESITTRGAGQLAIHELREGIVSRGVLLDIPRVRGVDYLDLREAVTPEDLERAEAAARLRVESGDVLLVRKGRWVRREQRGPWAPMEGMMGLDAACLPWLHARGVAALGSDGVSDVLPSPVEGVPMPIHTVAIVVMGVHLLDNLDLDGLARACAEEGRWEFQLLVSPLVIERGTASPVNPIALF